MRTTSAESFSVRHVDPGSRTFAGSRALADLSAQIDRSGASRVVLVHGPSLQRFPEFMGKVREAVGPRLAATFAEVAANSPVTVVEQAARTLTDHDADAVVVVGGGSAVVTARAAVILAGEQRPIRDLCTRREGTDLISPRLAASKITQWVVPTTPTTACAKAGAAVLDTATGERLALFDPKARASGVFLHPDAAATAPSRLVLSSALDAFTMCVDGLQSPRADPFAEALMRHALRLVGALLPQCDAPVDGSARVKLMTAAMLAGQASNHVGAGLSQPIGHALGPRSRVGNGIVEAMLLPHVMRFNKGHTDAGLTAIAETLAPSSPAEPGTAIAAVESFLHTNGVPTRLRDVGLVEDHLMDAVDHVLEDWAAATVPRRTDRSLLANLLASAW